jgi:hypothetical protein
VPKVSDWISAQEGHAEHQVQHVDRVVSGRPAAPAAGRIGLLGGLLELDGLVAHGWLL